jgi:lipopolysaccharide transport system ATP-binding protein
MSTDARRPAISVRNVGKRYDLYDRNFNRFRDLVCRTPGQHARPFWALRECSFDVYPGESVGIVGRNGSGKSTLMQMIAGTLTPTEGEIHIRGRISALLELGSGFNPAFTGRENVYLAGAILGITSSEMDDRFDDIAAFADIGEFLEQPVEVYSSGMHARLAFSVAVCVQPDILIVDEILSVGDAGFQQRCVGRMRQMLDSGVTLLFVSHAPELVKSVCSAGLFLRQGKQEYFGPSGEAVDRYVQSLRLANTERAQQNVAATRPELAQPIAKPGVPESAPAETTGSLRYGTGHGRVLSVELLDAAGQAAKAFHFGERITIEVILGAETPLDKLDLVMAVRDKAGVEVFGTSVITEEKKIRPMAIGDRRRVRFSFHNALAGGPHGVSITFFRRPDTPGDGMITLDHLDGCAAFDVIKGERLVRGKVHLPVEVQFLPVTEPAPASSP